MGSRVWFGLVLALLALALILAADSNRFPLGMRRVAGWLGVLVASLLVLDGFYDLPLVPGSWEASGVILLGVQARALWKMRLGLPARV